MNCVIIVESDIKAVCFLLIAVIGAGIALLDGVLALL